MKEHKELLEWAEFCGNYYGTPRKYVVEQLTQGKNVILEIEVQGALQVKKIYPEYDYVVINDTIGQATEDMLTIVQAERMKCSRNPNIKKIFKGEM